MNEKRLYIGEVAESLNRKPHTVRVWLYQHRLPEHLIPHRDERNWRYWTDEQLEGLKLWLVEADLRPGKGLDTTKG